MKRWHRHIEVGADALGCAAMYELAEGSGLKIAASQITSPARCSTVEGRG